LHERLLGTDEVTYVGRVERAAEDSYARARYYNLT